MKEKLLKIDAVIEEKAQNLLGKHEDNAEQKEEILNVLSSYAINRAIALELHDHSSVEHLTKEVINRLNKF